MKPDDRRERDVLPPSKRTPGAQRWCAWCGDDLPRDRHDVGTCDDRCGAALREEAGW